ncbi:hypothetical protein RFI_12382 [Reticulomyxa filosa]|uniref:Uncharacterized protein n=1 Tax=Reticulomyxa filosa TaxID=46433 RepID=X6NFV1_RETFI|nr:hypothetical protein RFI_12382 [Reticulomyxa filosa]|eukprot:ETO24773.1 hypothetical protein RFI_12382 [Reticulomyxa filosa]
MDDGKPFVPPKVLEGYFELEESPMCWKKRWIEISLETYTIRAYRRKYDRAEIQREKKYNSDELIDLQLKMWFDERPLKQKRDKIFYGLDIGIEGKTDWLRIRTIHPIIVREWRELIAQVLSHTIYNNVLFILFKLQMCVCVFFFLKWSQCIMLVKTGGYLPAHQYHFPINPLRTRMCDVKDKMFEAIKQVNYGGTFLWIDPMGPEGNALDQKVTIAKYSQSTEKIFQKNKREFEIEVNGYYWILQEYKQDDPNEEEKVEQELDNEQDITLNNLVALRDEIAYKPDLLDSNFCIDELMREEEVPRLYMFSRMREMLHEIIRYGRYTDLTFDEEITEKEFKQQVHYHEAYPEILHLNAKMLDTLMNNVRERYYSNVHKKCGYPLSLTQVMALYLYTFYCQHFTKDQRARRYEKWKYWDHCLYWAIFRMCGHDQRHKEKGKLYTGWHNAELKQAQTNGYFSTYCSTSKDFDTAGSFMSGNGCILEFDSSLRRSFQLYSCNIEWVSHYPAEKEVLFARGYAHPDYHHQEYWVARVIEEKSTPSFQWIQLSARVRTYYEETLRIKKKYFDKMQISANVLFMLVCILIKET